MRLGDYIDVLSGYAFKSKQFNTEGKGIQVVRIRDVGKERSETYYEGEYKENFILNNGDLLIGMDGDFRLAEWKGGKALLNQRVCKITVGSNDLYRNYLMRMLPRELKRIEDTTSFATVKHLSVKKINDIDLPLPPLEEQKKIAAILDAADDYRQKTKALIDKYDQLIQSLFLDMFGDPVTNPMGWDYCKLSDIADYFIGLTYKPGNVQKEGTIVLRSSNVQNSKLSFKDIVRVDINVKDKLLVKPNDILMCTRNGSSRLVGKVALIGNEKEEMTFGAFMTIIRSDNYTYLLNFFKTTGFRRQILTGATTTVNQITKNMLNRVELQLPPVELQDQFAQRVAQIEKQKQQAEASLLKAEKLFNSLLQKAFKGELTN